MMVYGTPWQSLNTNSSSDRRGNMIVEAAVTKLHKEAYLTLALTGYEHAGLPPIEPEPEPAETLSTHIPIS